MKNKIFPSGQDWDKIVDDAFRSNDVHTFSDNYLQRKASLQKGFVMKKNVKNPKHTLTATLAASAAVVIAVPAAIFAFNSSKNTVPSTDVPDVTEDTTVISTAECTTAAETTETITEPATEAMDYLTVDYTYLPEGFKRSVDCEQIFNSERGSSIKPLYLYGNIDKQMSVYTENLNYEKENAENLEEYSLDDKDVVLTYRTNYSFAPNDCNTFGRIAFMQFRDTDFYAYMFVTNDVTDDELKAIIEGMRAVPCDHDITQRWFNDEAMEGLSFQECTRDDLRLYKVGETIHNEKNLALFNEDVEITVKDVKVQKSLDGISDNATEMPQIDSSIFDEGWSIVTLDISYYNPTDCDLSGHKNFLTCICPSVFSLDKPFNTEAAEEYCYDSWLPVAYYSDSFASKNNIDLPAYGTADITVSFLVSDENFGDLYVDVSGHGTNANGVLDLCDLKPAK